MPRSARTQSYRSQKLLNQLKPAIQTDDSPRLDGVHTTLYPGSQLIISLGLAYGRVVITYPHSANPSVVVEPGPDQPAVKTEFERVKIAEVLDRGEGQGEE